MPLEENYKLMLSESQSKPAEGKQDEESPTSPTLSEDLGKRRSAAFGSSAATENMGLFSPWWDH